MNKDFTIPISKNRLMISHMRFVKREKDIVLTIYYPYLSVLFTKNKQLNLKINKFIFENDTEHRKNFHKVDEPYDWHIHIKIEEKDLVRIFKIFKLNLKDLDKIEKGFKNPSLENNGSKSKKALLEHKYYIKLSDIYYDKFKNEIITPYYGMANYVIRICKLDKKFDGDKRKILEYAWELFLVLNGTLSEDEVKGSGKYMDLCKRKINLNGITESMKILKNTHVLTPLKN